MFRFGCPPTTNVEGLLSGRSRGYNRSSLGFGTDGKGAVEIYQEKRFLTVTGYEDLVESLIPFSSK